MTNNIIKEITLISMWSLIMTTSSYSEKGGNFTLTNLHSSEPTNLIYSDNQKTIVKNTKDKTSNVINHKPKTNKKNKPKEQTNTIKNNPNIVEILNNIKISKKWIWKIEYNHFIEYFNLENSTPEEIYSKIKSFTSDWKLWPIALRKIYTEVYSKDLKNCSIDVKKRWRIHNEMMQYPQKYSRWIKPNMKYLDVFKHMSYYWDSSLWYKVKWTLINENLYRVFLHEIDYKKPRIVIENHKWKTTLRYYQDWKLQILTYTSPWAYNTRSPSDLKKPLENRWITDKYHTSANKKYKWSVMPFYIYVYWKWIAIHASDHKINWKPESGWCFRIDFESAEPLFNYIEKLPNNTLQIIIKKIY